MNFNKAGWRISSVNPSDIHEQIFILVEFVYWQIDVRWGWRSSSQNLPTLIKLQSGPKKKKKTNLNNTKSQNWILFKNV